VTKEISPACSPIIDIGANLTNKAFNSDIEQTIQRAQIANVQQIVVTGTNVKESEQAAQMAAAYPGTLFSTAGVHPHDAKHFDLNSLSTIRALAQLPQVVALGETGLDFNRNFSTPTEQINAFEQQLELAAELKLPLFLHERDAFKKQWEILKAYRDDLNNAVIHCFTGSREQAFSYLDLDLYIGITGWICDDQRGSHLREFMKDIPLNRLMVETDSPYLIPKVKPKPALKSSRRNEPCTLPLVIETIAYCCQQSNATIAQATTQNATTFFSLPPAQT
jgi:TatD DNase family protein